MKTATAVFTDWMKTVKTSAFHVDECLSLHFIEKTSLVMTDVSDLSLMSKYYYRCEICRIHLITNFNIYSVSLHVLEYFVVILWRSLQNGELKCTFFIYKIYYSVIWVFHCAVTPRPHLCRICFCLAEFCDGNETPQPNLSEMIVFVLLQFLSPKTSDVCLSGGFRSTVPMKMKAVMPC